MRPLPVFFVRLNIRNHGDTVGNNAEFHVDAQPLN